MQFLSGLSSAQNGVVGSVKRSLSDGCFLSQGYLLLVSSLKKDWTKGVVLIGQNHVGTHRRADPCVYHNTH